MILRSLAMLLLVAVSAAAADRADEPDPLRRAVVAVEQARQDLREAAYRPDPYDRQRVSRDLQRVEELIAATPLRGAVSELRERFSKVSEGLGGRLRSRDALGFEEELAQLSEQLRELLKLRLRYPPPLGDEASSAEAEHWRDRLVEIREAENLRFDHEEEGRFSALMRRAYLWLAGAVDWLFDLSPGKGRSLHLARIVLVLAIGSLALVLARWLLSRSASPEDEPVEEPPPRPLARERPARWAEALDAARQGAWERAVRLGYLHLVGELERSRLLAGAPSRTTGEMVGAVRASGWPRRGVESLAEAGRVFDRSRYGGLPAGREGWEVMAASREAVEALLARGDRKGDGG